MAKRADAIHGEAAEEQVRPVGVPRGDLVEDVLHVSRPHRESRLLVASRDASIRKGHRHETGRNISGDNVSLARHLLQNRRIFCRKHPITGAEQEQRKGWPSLAPWAPLARLYTDAA